jgi:hypothetical protein
MRYSFAVRKRRDLMKSIRVATPCPTTWEGMAGDDKVRHCTLCDLNVYNFEAMSREEIHERLMGSEGRVCARLYRRADGTLLTSDCPSGVRALRQRLSRVSSAAMAVLLSIAALLSGCATGKFRLPRNKSKVELEIEQMATLQQAVFAGVVRDESGNPLPGVSVVVRDEAVQCELAAITDANGAFSIHSLNEGLYRVEVRLIGFGSALVEHVPLKHSEITRAQVSLHLDPTDSITVGAIAVDPMMTTNGLSTTFTQDFLNKLPLR